MFSRACKYAIRSVLFLAVNSNSSNRIGVKEIADELGVPRHFLAKVLMQLAKHHLISSAKGPHGGFFSTKGNQEENLIRVIECIDGMDAFNSCVLGLPVCSDENPCPLHFQTSAFRESLFYQLRHQSIAEIVGKIKQFNITL